MSRLRASLTDSAIDALVHRELGSAKHAIERAIHACRSTKTGPDVDAARLRRVIRDLGKAHYALSSVGSVASPYRESTAERTRDQERETERTAYWARRTAEAERQAAEEAAAEAAAMAVAEASVEGGD